ncbi:MAG: hypothetical protein EZS28_001743 [Streblomastix strix]|uniref:MYND-type domain-containing protein n=1 Tax=Streblomastix strix TaxID=222440 RepID=A0A5J4X6D5_9EUKA|nr:MAG: hypothetical protein EZS28_001743 [Streblomastix strix]
MIKEEIQTSPPTPQIPKSDVKQKTKSDSRTTSLVEECFGLDWSDGGGIYAISTMPFTVGQLICKEEPYVSQVSYRELEQRCAQCRKSKENATLQKCSQCKVIHYCCRECQRLHWKRHKFECEVFSKLNPVYVQGTYRLMIRAVLRVHSEIKVFYPLMAPENKFYTSEGISVSRNIYTKQKKDQQQQTNQVKQKIFKTERNLRMNEIKKFNTRQLPSSHTHSPLDIFFLISNRNNMPQEYITQFEHLAEQILKTIGIDPKGRAKFYTDCTALDEAVIIMCQVKCNCLGQSLQGFGESSISLFPRIALFNHSCRPNCRISFGLNGVAYVKTVQQIQPYKMLTIPYTSLIETWAFRQNRLRNWFYFDCSCVRCLDAALANKYIHDQEMDQSLKKLGKIITEGEKKGEEELKEERMKFINQEKLRQKQLENLDQKELELKQEKQVQILPNDLYLDALICECGNPMVRTNITASEYTISLYDEQQQIDLSDNNDINDDKRDPMSGIQLHEFHWLLRRSRQQLFETLRLWGKPQQAFDQGKKLQKQIEFAQENQCSSLLGELYFSLAMKALLLNNFIESHKYVTRALEINKILAPETNEHGILLQQFQNALNIECRERGIIVPK